MNPAVVPFYPALFTTSVLLDSDNATVCGYVCL